MPVSVALCVLTFRRPVGLRELLFGIGRLDVSGLDLDVRVVVVDNDPGAAGRTVVEKLAPDLPFPVAYETEPRRGIPIARNRALRVAGEVDFVGWLDDDEVPRPDWLRRLVDMQRATGAEVVIGPSVPRLPAGTPAWVEQGGFFERTRFPSGSRIPGNYARTSGVLVCRRAMPSREAVFDERLRFSGGSDRELFVEMERAGARFVWVDEAVVEELVPASRARGRWILQRAFRIGNSRSTTLVLAGAPVRRRAGRAGKGAAKMTVGALAAARGLPRGRAAVARGAWQCCYGAGLLTGALGFRYSEYRQHHGA